MKTLTDCLRAAKVAERDAAAIRALRDSFKGDGLSAEEAGRKAVLSYAQDLLAERTELAGQILATEKAQQLGLEIPAHSIEAALNLKQTTTAENTDVDNGGIQGAGAGTLGELSAEVVQQPGGSGETGGRTGKAGAKGQKRGGGTDGAGTAPGRGGRIRAAAADPDAAGKENDGEQGAGRGDAVAGDGDLTLADIPAAIPAANFQITDEVELGSGGAVTKFKDNLAAIRTLKQLELEQRRATPDEQRILARYVGWGGLPQAFRNRLTGEVKADWAERAAELESLLSEKELRDAAASTRNAHYTSKPVVEFVWAAAQRLGFSGGMVLEPSVGTGNFIGLMPESLQPNSQLSGVELDSITARIAAKLYPQSHIMAMGFEEVPLPANRFDLAIGNPPFGDISLNFPFNPDINGKSIHNQFFLNSLEAVRPGGVLAMVVSRYLLDAKDASTRKLLSQQAELVGAVRLPGIAFKQNAGTEVVTDVIFLRKRAKPVQAVDSWTETTTIPDPNGGEPITVSRYFAENPDMVVGRIDRSGSMRQAGDVDVSLPEGADFVAMMNEKLAQLPEVSPLRDPYWLEETRRFHEAFAGAMKLQQQDAEVGQVYRDENGALQKVMLAEGADGETLLRQVPVTQDTPWSSSLGIDLEGRWFEDVVVLDAEGKPVKQEGGRLNRYERKTYASAAEVGSRRTLGKSGYERLSALVDLRDLLRAQISLEAERAENKKMEANRKKLRQAYEAFVKQHGYLSERKNAGIISDLPDEALLLSLEKKFKAEVTPAKAKRLGIKPSAASAEPADILSKPVAVPQDKARSAESLADAMGITLSETGRLDLARIAELLGVNEDQAAERLLSGDKPMAFRDPEQGGRIVERNAYLSGNVRRKLEAAILAQLPENVRELEAVQPERWTSDQITPVLGGAWIPERVYADFLRHITGSDNAAVRFSALTNSFDVLGDASTAQSKSQWGTKDMPAPELMSNMLNSRKIEIAHTDRDGKRWVDQVATQEAQDKAKELQAEWEDWVFKDFDRRSQLTDLFNDLFNVRVNRQHDGSHMTYPGKVPDDIIKFRRGQNNAIWRGITERSVLYDHAVGAGKAQPLDAKILTPRGWVRMGDIKPGDQVISVDGLPTLVEAVFPQGDKEIFRVTFSDGSSTECCNEHLWFTQTYYERTQNQRALKLGKDWECGKGKVRELAEIRQTLKSGHLGAKNHSIPIVAPVEFAAAEVPIDPYVLGALLGDGGMTADGVILSTPDEAIADECARRLPAGVAMNRIKTGDRCPSWSFVADGAKQNAIKDHLDSIGLRGKPSWEKHIPDAYLFNSVEVRLDLLRGLMDTDGSVSRKGASTYFYSTSPWLRDGVAHLVRSLGGTLSITQKTPTYTYKGEKHQGRICYVLCIKMPAEINPFLLERKASQVVSKTSYGPVRYIVEVEAVGMKPAQCIRVAHPSHLYVTDDFIVTHNTFVGIARALERKRMGLARKPLVVVPNHIVTAWGQDIYKLYPGAKALVATKRDLEKKNRRRFFARMATGDWDVVIMPHSSFQFLGLSAQRQEAYLKQELAIAEEALKDAEAAWKESGEGGFRKPPTVKQAENLVAKIEQRLKKLLDKQDGKDRLLTFEQIGIDDLTIDEAHEFKNLQYGTSLNNVRGMGNQAGSQKALDLYFKTKYLHETQSGLAFLTGTPISNSAVEMYTLLRYLAPDVLAEMGLEHFDAFRAQYVSVSGAYEPTDSGSGLKWVDRLGREWQNMRALMDAYYSVADVVTNDDIKAWFAEDNPGQEYPLPKVKGGSRRAIEVEPTPTQARLLDEVIARFENLKDIDDPDERNAERLRAMDAARKVSLHAKAVDPTLEDEPGGKLDRVADEAKRIYDRWTPDKGTQLIFLDRSIPKTAEGKKQLKAYDDLVAKADEALAKGDEDAYRKLQERLDEYDRDEIAAMREAQAGGWNGYQHIKDRLVADGIPAEEIAFIHDYNTDEKKRTLFDAVNDGVVRILIGSSQRMGAGTNVQERLVGLHHVDATWKPSDIEQRDGRIIRQGNALYQKYPDFEVEINAYVTSRTVDAKLWSLNATKLKMINAIRHYQGQFEMTFDDEDSVSMAEIAAIASGDPLLLERFALQGDIDQLNRSKRSWRRRVQSAEDSAEQARRTIEQGNNPAERAEARHQQAKALVTTRQKSQPSLQINGQTFDDKVAAQLFIEEMSKQGDQDDQGRVRFQIDGKSLSKTAALEQVEDTFGDTLPFQVELGGTRYNKRSKWAAAVIPKLADGQQVAFSYYGKPALIEAYDSRSGGLVFELSLKLDDGSAMGYNLVGRGYGVRAEMSKGLRDALREFERDLDSTAARSQAENYRKALERAKADQPVFAEQAKERFKSEQELSEKLTRLAEVERILKERADEKAGKGKAAADETNADDTPQASRRQGRAAGTSLSAIRQVFAERFGNLARALDKMIDRGEKGLRGGLVFVKAEADLAKAFAEKTGRSLEQAQAALQMSKRGEDWYRSNAELEKVYREVMLDRGTPESQINESELKAITDAASVFLSSQSESAFRYDPTSPSARAIYNRSRQSSANPRRGSGRIRAYEEPLGPFSGYSVKQREQDGVLILEFFGKEQLAEGLTDSPFLFVGITPTGELAINGPISSSKTYDYYAALGWAESAKDKDGNLVPMPFDKTTYYTRFKGEQDSLGRRDIFKILGEAHARAKEHSGEAYVGIHWKRDTGATGGPMGREGAIFFSQNGQIQGLFDPQSGLTFLVGDNLDASTAPGVVLHEVTHGAQRKAVNQAAANILNNPQRLPQRARGVIATVRGRMQAAGAMDADGNITDIDEAPAYLVEVVANTGRENGFSAIDGAFMDWVDRTFGQKIGNLMRDFVAMVRAGLRRMRVPVQLTVDDIMAMARYDMQRAADGRVREGGEVVSGSAREDARLTTMLAQFAGKKGAPTEAEIREAARQYRAVEVTIPESGELLAPNGKPSKLNREQWILVRTPNFKRWFGNWNYDENTQASIVDITGDVSVDTNDTAALREWLLGEYGGDSARNQDSGVEILLTSSGLRSSLKRRGDEQRQAYSALKQLIENAIYFETVESDRKTLAGQDVYFAGLQIGETLYSVKIKADVRHDRSTSYKDHKVEQIADIEINPAVFQGSQSGIGYPGATGLARSGSYLSIGQLTKGVKPEASKVVDENGEPMVVYHGTLRSFDQFDRDAPRRTRGGRKGAFYFTGNPDIASAYAGTAEGSQWNDETRGYDKVFYGVEDGGNVVPSFLSIKTPLVFDGGGRSYTEVETMAFDAINQKNDDGIIFNDMADSPGAQGSLRAYQGVTYVAFKPDQIKSAIGNTGTYSDRGDIRFSRAASNPDPNDDLPVLDNINQARESILSSLKSVWDKSYGARLGALTLRQLGEVAADRVPQINGMVKSVQAMQTERNKMADAASKLAERWQKLGKQASDQLAEMMHAATAAGVDPAKRYRAIIDTVQAQGRIDQIKRLMAGAPGTGGKQREAWNAEIKELKIKIGQEINRKKIYPELKQQWEALPDEAKAIYREARDSYVEMSKRTEQAIIDRIEQAELAERWKKAAIARVRQEFESARVESPYFPLQRFGDYYIKARKQVGEKLDKKTGEITPEYQYAFWMFDSPKERSQARREIQDQGWEITRMGLRQDVEGDMDSVSEIFIAGVVQQLQEQMGDYTGKAAADIVYQEMLKAMPFMSHRIHFVHRKKTPGWSNDALRAYAFNMAHQATQVARMEQAPRLQQLLMDMDGMINEIAAEDVDVTEQETLAAEARKRFEWVMNPQGNKYSSMATTAGFLWYLGATPAAALVNLSQTAIVAFPELAARFNDTTGAFRELAKAGKEVMAARTRWKTRGDYSTWDGLSEDEREAFKHWHGTGVIDNTQAHMLMGVSETDSGQYNPHVAKAIEIAGSLFHEAEIINREATLLAAYRLARSQGMNREAALEQAQESVWASHFDYSNANRARWMQGNVAKVFLLFRSYSQHMTYLLVRNFQQMLKGESAEVKAAARKRFFGTLGMTGMFAGVMGMPLMSVIFGIANAVQAMFGDDDDEPWDAKTEFRNALADLGLLGAVIDRGAINALTGQNWSSRVGLDQLWIRDSDRDLDGKGLYMHYLEQFAGPVFGIGALQFRAAQLWGDGEYQRAIETAMPKVVKDGLKSMRYADEGVLNMKGDPVVSEDQLTPFDIAWQAIGFAPDKVAAQYAANNQAKAYELRILDRRSRLMGAYAMAVMAGDGEARVDAMRQIRRYNQSNPSMRIDQPALNRSLKARQRYRKNADAGIHLNPNLSYLRDETRVAI